MACRNSYNAPLAGDLVFGARALAVVSRGDESTRLLSMQGVLCKKNTTQMALDGALYVPLTHSFHFKVHEGVLVKIYLCMDQSKCL
jgi:hypothetical protein